MKPTQREIIELAREAGIVFDERAMPYYERLVHLALERFGAGGGEPVLFSHPDIFAMKAAHVGVSKPGHELPGYIPLYTHASPTDLRAEYLRGLEDAAKVARAGYDEFWKRHDPEFPKARYDQASVLRTLHATVEFVSTDIADAIEALKGKQ